MPNKAESRASGARETLYIYATRTVERPCYRAERPRGQNQPRASVARPPGRRAAARRDCTFDVCESSIDANDSRD